MNEPWINNIGMVGDILSSIMGHSWSRSIVNISTCVHTKRKGNINSF